MGSSECKAELVRHFSELGHPTKVSQWRRRDKSTDAQGRIVRVFEHPDQGTWAVREEQGRLEVLGRPSLTPVSLPQPEAVSVRKRLWSDEDLEGAKRLIEALRAGEDVETIEASEDFRRHGHALPAWVEYSFETEPAWGDDDTQAWEIGDDRRAVNSMVSFIVSSQHTLGTGPSTEQDDELDIGYLIRELLPDYLPTQSDEVLWEVDPTCTLTIGQVAADLDARGFASQGWLDPAVLLEAPAPVIVPRAIREAIERQDVQSLRTWITEGAFDPRRVTKLSEDTTYQENWLCWTARHGHGTSFMALFDEASRRGFTEQVPKLIEMARKDAQMAATIWLPLLRRLPMPSINEAKTWLEASARASFGPNEGMGSPVMIQHLERHFRQAPDPTYLDQVWNQVARSPWGLSDVDLREGLVRHFQGRTLPLVNAFLAEGRYPEATRLLGAVPTDGPLATLDGRPAIEVLREQLPQLQAQAAQRLRSGFIMIEEYADGTRKRVLTSEEEQLNDLQQVIGALAGVPRPPPRNRPRLGF